MSLGAKDENRVTGQVKDGPGMGSVLTTDSTSAKVGRHPPGNLSMSSKCGSQASSDNSQGTAGLSSAQILQRLEQAWSQ